MFQLETPRLILVETPLEVMETRIRQATAFSAILNLPAPEGKRLVTFPADWPGDALVLFPLWVEQAQHAPQDVPWGGVLIDRAEDLAVGQMGCKGRPQDGSVEIGYGLIPSHQGRGYATEMARALSAWILTQPGVERVTAECRTDNAGSIRVLEKSGFSRCGERMDEEDGPLILWERTC